ncbi:MAG: redoxin family protein [Planctomycetaceae bacterium]|nr:redoxin family protein [Planctomycetaceae bacterium]
MRFQSRLVCLLVVAGMLTLTCQAPAGETQEVSIGDTIVDVTFKDIRYLPRRLSEFGEHPAYVAVFVNTTCPIVQRYMPKLKRLHEAYPDVQFMAINVSEADSIRDMAMHALEYDVPFPFVKDIAGNCVEAMGVQRTPEVVVLDAERNLRYRGRIDDQYRLGGNTPRVTSDELKNAIDAVLAGTEVSVAETAVDGCRITPYAPVEPDESLTWESDIAPLMKKHCAECHQPNTEAPFALLSYEDVAANAEMVAETVAEERMPPWYGAPEDEEFINDRSMTEEEKQTILKWVAAGAPAGNEKVTVVPDDVREGRTWLLGEPDRVITALEEHKLPAEGYVDYQYSILPYVFEEDTWVQKVEILPDNPRVVHHCNLLMFKPTEGIKTARFITGKVPGVGALSLENGIAVHFPRGHALALQIHYTTTGQKERCRLSLGLTHARETVKKSFRHVLVSNYGFQIAPGDGHSLVKEQETFEHDVTGIGMFSHMHVRGKDMTFTAEFPDGKREKLLTVPNYSFDWQLGYEWPERQRKFPAGTKIEVEAHFDNSKFNPYNPDPTETVGYGPQTYHEMMMGFFFYTQDDENLNLTIDPKTGHVVKETASR